MAGRIAERTRPERETRNRHLRALAKVIAAYEAEFGTITEAEMLAQQRADRRAAIRIKRTRRARR